MTNLLLLISASTMMIFLQTCGRKSAESETSKADSSGIMIIYDSTTNVIDTVRFDSPEPLDSAGLTPAQEAGTKPGKTEKVPSTNPVKKDIPEHKSQDQAKVDSIKKSKEKIKKKSDDGGEEDKG